MSMPTTRRSPSLDSIRWVTYGLSFHHHSGRWEPMPFSGDLAHMATVIVETLGAYLAP